MGAAVPSDDTEAQSVWSSFEIDGLILRWADGKMETVRDSNDFISFSEKKRL